MEKKRHMKKKLSLLVLSAGVLIGSGAAGSYAEALEGNPVQVNSSEAATPAAGPNIPAQTDQAIVSLLEQPERFVFGYTKQKEAFSFEEGLYVRTVHSFWDGSKGVFVNNRRPETGELSAFGNGQLLEWLMVMEPYGDGGPQPHTVAVPATAERSGRGLTAVAKDSQGQYWTIREGNVEERIATPRGGLFIQHHSLQLMTFAGVDGTEKRIIDVGKLLGVPTKPDRYIADVASGDGLILVKLVIFDGQEDNQVAVLNEAGELLFTKSTNAISFFPVSGGGLGYIEQDEVVLADRSGKEVRRVKLTDLSPQLVSYTGVRVTPMRNGVGYVLDSGRQWFAVNADFTKILSQSPKQGPLQPVECPNCTAFETALPVNGSSYLLVSDKKGMVLEEFLPVRIQFFGVPLYTESPSVLDASEGRVWVPLREVVTAMGYQVSYDGAERVIVLTPPGGGEAITISQDHPQLEMRTVKEFGRAYVSIRQLSELLGKPVTWDPNTYTVFVADGEQLHPTVPEDILKDEGKLKEHLSHLDDFDAVTYTQAQIKEIWAKGEQTDVKQAVELFLRDTPRKKLKSLIVLSEQERSLWIGAITQDGFVYKIQLLHCRDYGGDFWIVMTYGDLVVTE